MEDLLASRGFLVSGTLGFTSIFGLPYGPRGSLRFLALPEGSSYKTLFLLVLELEEGGHKEAIDLEHAVASHPHASTFGKYFAPLKVLVTFPEGFVLEGQSLREQQLVKWFESLDQRFVASPGARKNTNDPQSLRQSDSFRRFTRRFLSARLIVNDIDALRLPEESARGILLELKRPKGDITGWKPYINDCPNFTFLKHLSKRVDFDFYLIAYNAGKKETVRLVADLACLAPNPQAPGNRIVYKTGLFCPWEVLDGLSSDPTALYSRLATEDRI